MEPYLQLERDWATWNGLDPAGMVACASGTAALHLSLEAFRLPPGSEVIVPDFTMIAVPRAVTLAGLTPVFVDCADDLNVDWNLLKNQWWTEECKLGAATVVHTYGKRCDMELIHGRMKLVRDSSDGVMPVPVVEDLAEAHSVRPHPLTDAACWSFYKNKIVCGEEGGAVWFRDPEHAELARQLRSLGFTAAHDFTHVPRGHNYRMSNAHAALILNSLRRVDLSLKNRWAQWDELANVCPAGWMLPRPDAPWVFALRVPGITELGQDRAVMSLGIDGIAARHAFKPCHTQDEYNRCKAVGPERRWGSCIAAKEVLYLPLSGHNVRPPVRAFGIIEAALK